MKQPFGRFAWHDVMTTDIESAIDFFVGLFGWSIQVIDTAQGKGNYRAFHAADRAMGGFVALDPGQDVASHWLGYVSVDNLDRVVTASDSAGGFQAVPPTEIPNVGKIAVLRDPSGGAIAPIERQTEPDILPKSTEEGQICWNELHTPDGVICAPYYAAILGWKPTDRMMGSFGPYTVFSDGTEDVAGMAGSEVASLPFPVWIPYVRVKNLAQAVNRVQQLGGTIWLLPVDIPDVGSVAIVADPSGAPTGLFQSSD